MYPSIKKFVQEPLFAQHRKSENQIKKIDQEIRKMTRKLSLGPQTAQFQTFVSINLNQFRQLNDGLQSESSEANKMKFGSRNLGSSPRVVKVAKSNNHRPSEACLPLLEKNMSQTKLPSLYHILAVEQMQSLEMRKANKIKVTAVDSSKFNVMASKPKVLVKNPIKSVNFTQKDTNFKVSNRASINNRLKQIQLANGLLKGSRQMVARMQNHNDFYKTLKDQNVSPNTDLSNKGIVLNSDELSLPKLLPENFKKLVTDGVFAKVVPATDENLGMAAKETGKQPTAYKKRLKLRKTKRAPCLSFDCSVSGSQSSSSSEYCEETEQQVALNSANKEVLSRRSQAKKSISQDPHSNTNIKVNPNRWKEDMKRFSSFLKRFVNNTPKEFKNDHFSNTDQQIQSDLDFSYLKRVSHSRYLSNSLAHKNIQRDNSDAIEDQEHSKSEEIDNLIFIQEEFVMARCPMSNLQNDKVFKVRFSVFPTKADCYSSQWMVLIDKLNQEEKITNETPAGLYELNNQVYGQSLQKRFCYSEAICSLIGVLSHVANNIHADHCRILGGV